jgi:uncharacterized protein YndB with AHSA1/START domain
MTLEKDLKRLVRARMAKTGESYTAARGQILTKTGTPVEREAPTPADYETLAGIANRRVEEKTGCAWEGWVPMLDGLDAADMKHREIAALVHRRFKLNEWWSQTITVGYERIKGRRAIGQRIDGRYEAGKSRTFPVPVTTLFDAWRMLRRRKQWLGDAPVSVRTVVAPKSIRLDWGNGTVVTASFTAKGPGKSSVAVSHSRLDDRAEADRLRQYWAERLDALGEALSSRARSRRTPAFGKQVAHG